MSGEEILPLVDDSWSQVLSFQQYRTADRKKRKLRTEAIYMNNTWRLGLLKFELQGISEFSL